MVDGELTTCAAVLAFEVVAFKYILPCKINALVRGVNISIQPDNRRHGKILRDSMQSVAVRRPYHFTFIEKYENKGAFH